MASVSVPWALREGETTPKQLASDLAGGVTTIAYPTGQRLDDLVQRRFAPTAPDRLLVMDMVYVSTC